MIIYEKTSGKTKTCAARVYIREDSVVLRLYLSQIDKHSKYIEHAPEYILDVFTNSSGQCAATMIKAAYANAGNLIPLADGITKNATDAHSSFPNLK